MPQETTRGPVVPSSQPDPNAQKKKRSDEVNRVRRRFIWTFLWGYLGVNFLMFLRYFFPRALFEPTEC